MFFLKRVSVPAQGRRRLPLKVWKNGSNSQHKIAGDFVDGLSFRLNLIPISTRQVGEKALGVRFVKWVADDCSGTRMSWDGPHAQCVARHTHTQSQASFQMTQGAIQTTRLPFGNKSWTLGWKLLSTLLNRFHDDSRWCPIGTSLLDPDAYKNLFHRRGRLLSGQAKVVLLAICLKFNVIVEIWPPEFARACWLWM